VLAGSALAYVGLFVLRDTIIHRLDSDESDELGVVHRM